MRRLRCRRRGHEGAAGAADAAAGEEAGVGEEKSVDAAAAGEGAEAAGVVAAEPKGTTATTDVDARSDRCVCMHIF